MPEPAFCRDCLADCASPRRCASCGSLRVVAHPELWQLSIAHMDCDAFYASVEKRDNPALRDRPVIIGGGKRGVVSTACYIARVSGVRSAMPMFQALKLCPDAVVLRPRMEVYAEVSRAIRRMMEELTPAVEPLSLDEAFLDLTGTARLHGEPPAKSMARLVLRMERELGVSGSVGLAPNKFLAKLASDMDKPRGFCVIGEREKETLLPGLPVKKIWGVGPAMQARLERDGIRTFADLRWRERKDLAARYGGMGERLWHLCRGEDRRAVSARGEPKSISNETTFPEDIGSADLLDGHLWRLAEKVSDRAKAQGWAGRTITLKVKRTDHKTLTRRVTLDAPTQLAERIYRGARPLLDLVLAEAPFRLLGVGISALERAEAAADDGFDLLEPDARRRAEAERAADRIRARFGSAAILRGRSLR